MSYQKSEFTGRTWSTPFNTPFFFRWGDWSIKVPMEVLREEYDAWEELQRHLNREGAPTDREAGETNDAHPTLSPNAFDWAEDVEHELFSDGSDSDDNSSSNPETASDSDTDQADIQIVDTTASASADVAVAGVSTEEGVEEVAVTPKKDEAAAAPGTITPTPATNADNTVYRVVKVSTASNALSIRMVKDGRPTATDGSTTAQKDPEIIQFLAGAGLLKLDTYETVFEAAARGCGSGDPFWLYDPALGYEVVV